MKIDRQLKSIEWFIDNIGRIVYSTFGCSCSVCNMQYLKGVRVSDLNHVNSLYSIQDTTNRRYFTSKEERLEYEQSLKG
jgi:hypothetical protein